MVESIVIRKCTNCQIVKPINEFYKSYKGTNGFMTKCKKCFMERNKIYKLSDRGKEIQRKYRTGKVGKESHKRYRKSEKGKRTRCEIRNRDILKHPNKYMARSEISHKIHSGKIKKPSYYECAFCYNRAEHYHHYLGYDKAHWLDVAPICFNCHLRIHAKAHS